MSSKTQKSSYFLRSSEESPKPQSKPEPGAPEYINRPEYIGPPKPSLDCMPLEILLEIAFYLPDARTSVQLSCVSSSLYWKLAGSQYFWYRFGNQVLKKFQKFSQTYDYHGYIIKAISGDIKSTCQICLTPKRGVVRKRIGKVVCMECFDDNVVRVDVVQQIPNMDFANLQEFEAMFYLNGEPDSKVNRFPWFRRPCYWLPAVKKEATRAYSLPWGEIMAKNQALNDIRPPASPKQIREYRTKVREKVFNTVVEKFRQELGKHFTGILDPDAFREMLIVEQSKTEFIVSVPTEGQIDRADDAWVGATALPIYVSYVGTQTSESQPAHVRTYSTGSLWGLISTRLLNRLTSAGKYRGGCRWCPNHAYQAANGNGYYFGATDLLSHVAHYHPEKLLDLNHSWDITTS
ncbi:hypothetical protein TWF506_000343 [Arthrobotrys conoides]|uniref:F-box domain-containing protein n=1 Tax=Arthrobotrys conoides TaxID=74498 RepID=A0AAN8S0U6_9PEZI